MKFFFPDSQDQVDPSFDFQTEERSPLRIRQRDDLYAHEVLREPAYDGVLVSKAIVDGLPGVSGRYTLAQKQRFHRIGVRRFLRLDRVKSARLVTMGDCGAFTYVREEHPPYSVDEVIDFYTEGRFDIGVSVDHVILGYQTHADNCLLGLDVIQPEWRERQELTLQLASEFRHRCAVRKSSFTPMGVAQGWSPGSYRYAVNALQKMGYQRIGLGGMVPVRTGDIIRCLRAIDAIRHNQTQLHLFGVTRCNHLTEFAKLGVTSFDSTAPFSRAFKDDRHNYYTPDRSYMAIRVPQVDGNPRLKRQIVAGKVDQRKVIDSERECMTALRGFDQGSVTLEDALNAVQAYQHICWAGKSRVNLQSETLRDRPWRACHCAICREIGIHVVLFRGFDRNKRRGFHNLYVFRKQLRQELDKANPNSTQIGTSKSVA